MAVAVKALNAKIRSNPITDYLFSTHFWGPVSNFGIPIAAVMDTQKEAAIISGPMTTALTFYSATFMRYALAVTPRNPLLFGCHFVNFGAQITQGYRYVNYWNYGGREADLATAAKAKAQNIGAEGHAMAGDAKESTLKLVEQTKMKAGEAKDKIAK